MELDYSVDTTTGKTFLNASRPQQGRSGVVRASIDALNDVEYQKLNRILEEEYKKTHTTILDKPFGKVITDTVNFFGNSYDNYSNKFLEASLSRKFYETESAYLDKVQTHLFAIALFIRDDENIIHLGIIFILLSILLCFFNISRGYGYSEITTKS